MLEKVTRSKLPGRDPSNATCVDHGSLPLRWSHSAAYDKCVDANIFVPEISELDEELDIQDLLNTWSSDDRSSLAAELQCMRHVLAEDAITEQPHQEQCKARTDTADAFVDNAFTYEAFPSETESCNGKCRSIVTWRRVRCPVYKCTHKRALTIALALHDGSTPWCFREPDPCI